MPLTDLAGDSARVLEPNLKLVDGPQFVDMLATHGVLLQLGKFGELKHGA